MTLKNFKIALLTFVMCLHITDVFSQEALVPEFELFDDTALYNGMAVELKSGNFIIPCESPNSKGILHKISPDGKVIANLVLSTPDDYQISASPFVIETENNGLVLMGISEPRRKISNSDEAIVFFHKIDEDLNILESKEYNIKIDTSTCDPTGSITYDPFDYLYSRARMFSAFEADGGIWACIYKATPVTLPLPGCLGNDSVFFCRFDYNGNLINTKTKEFFGCDNSLAFVGNRIKMTNEGYVIFLPELVGKRIRRLVIQRYDKEFNFIKEIERSYSNPDFYYDLSVKALSSGNTLVASCYSNANNGNGAEAGITIFDDELNRIDEQIYWGIDGWDISVGSWSSVDFVDENRIFWAYTDHYSIPDNWDYDTWLGINLLTADLEIEHTYFYDMYGEKSFMRLSTTKATMDGGLLLVGLINAGINTYPSKLGGFAVKFPAEAFLGIEEAHKYGLKTAVAYPNPGQNELNIKTGLENARIEVYNVQGGRVFESEAADKVTTIDASGWNSGIYLWKVIVDGKEVESGKWVK